MVVDGCPDRAKEEEEELAECLRALARSGVAHVVVVEGGYYAIHELLYRSDRLDWVVDHDEQQCRVCAHFRLEHVMEKMKASVNSTAQLLATHAKSALQKVQESIQTAQAGSTDPNDPNSQHDPKDPNAPKEQTEQTGLGMKEIQEKAQEGLSALGKKGMSLWSKALSWTKEKSSSLAEEVTKRVTNAVEEKEEEAIPKEDLFIVDEWEMLRGVMCSDDEDVFFDRSAKNKSLMSLVASLKKNQRFEEKLMSDGGALIYELDTLSTTDGEFNDVSAGKEIDAQKYYSVMLLANRVIVFYREEESCATVYNLDCKNLKKMTLKKDDPKVLSLYFMQGEGDVFLLRMKLDDAKDFVEDLQIMIEDNAE